jgi:hypothetical protein
MQATATLQQDELTALITKLKGNNQSELEQAECISQVLYSRSIDELDLSRAKSLWRTVRIEREEMAERGNTPPGTCFQCGGPTLSDSIEHRHCHEGFGPQEYSRTFKNSF